MLERLFSLSIRTTFNIFKCLNVLKPLINALVITLFSTPKRLGEIYRFQNDLRSLLTDPIVQRVDTNEADTILYDSVV